MTKKLLKWDDRWWWKICKTQFLMFVKSRVYDEKWEDEKLTCLYEINI